MQKCICDKTATQSAIGGCSIYAAGVTDIFERAAALLALKAGETLEVN